MKLDDYPVDPKFTATVLRTERITDTTSDEVREIVLEVDREDFKYHIGQSIGVLIEGPLDFGQTMHHRLYSVADTPQLSDSGKPEVTIVVRRCKFIDDYSGEERVGISSNYLCDLGVGDKITITGPFGIPFTVPEDKNANLFLIGLGTGIAPFRGLVKHIYQNIGDWKGKVRLLYGAHSGLELLYMNEKRDDFTQYYDEETFEAFKALSPRPEWADPIAWDYAIEDRAGEIASLLDDPHTYVYVAGLTPIRQSLDELFSRMQGSSEIWQKKKAELMAQDRWVEHLY